MNMNQVLADIYQAGVNAFNAGVESSAPALSQEVLDAVADHTTGRVGDPDIKAIMEHYTAGWVNTCFLAESVKILKELRQKA